MPLSKIALGNPIYDLTQLIGYHLQQMRWLREQSHIGLTQDEQRSIDKELLRFDSDIRDVIDDIVQQHRDEVRKAKNRVDIAASLVSGIVGALVTYLLLRVEHG